MITDVSNFDFTASRQTTYSTDPILEYMFDTAAKAVAQAKAWGYDGYRAYLINGTLKYVPCATSAEYEQATRLYIQQGAIVPQGKDVFGDKLVGYQFTDKDTIQGDPIFTLGNFSLTTNVTSSQNIVFTLADPARSFTASDLSVGGVDALKSQIPQNVKAVVRFDNTNLEKYVTYTSLSERFRVTLQEIAETFTASMHVVPHSITNTTVYGYTLYPRGDAATFKVRIAYINNPYTIDFYKTGITAAIPEYITPLRNFAKNYAQYEVYYDGMAYPIVGVVLPTGSSDPNGLVLTVQGDPFSLVVSSGGTANVNFYIKPNEIAFTNFYSGATDLAIYLLNPKSTPLYAATFNVPHRADDGSFQIIPQTLQFPMYDDFNVDIFNDPFDAYTSDLQAIADDFDTYKTNLIARFLTAESLQEFDTPDRKTYVTWQAYGQMFDEVKKYVDGISYMTSVSYDKLDNIPDVLLKNFAHMLGWETYEIEQDATLVQSLFSATYSRNGDTPQEIDIELWRRIIINSFYLFKSRGTRKAIEFVLELVGVPLEIMDINEYVYVAQHPLPYSYYYNLFHQNVTDYPIDVNGYPTIPPNVYFQAYGGSMLSDAQNIGAYDGGQAYVNAYKAFETVKAFDLQRVADNKKSWVVTTDETQQTYDLLLRDTNYTIKDSRLVINSKEADASISSQMTFDYYVYSLYSKNNYSISVFDATVEPAKLTFNDYLRAVTSQLIDPKNHKVIKTYPVLSKIYWDYLDYANALGLKTIDYVKTLEFIKRFDSYWVKLVQQFVPATTIFLAGKKFINAETTRSKFQYKHGLNPSKSWLGTDGSEFQDDALKPSPVGDLDIFQCGGTLGENLQGNSILISVEASLSEKATSYLTRGGYYDADSYGIYRHYVDTTNTLLLGHGNYGSMTGLTLNTGFTISPKAQNLYFITKNSGTGTINMGHKMSVSGTTEDVYIGSGKYAGYVTSGTTGSTFMTIGTLPTSSNTTLYPLHTLFLFALRSVAVNKNEEYVIEGDVMMETQISGNTTYSYIGLVPIYTGSTSPDNVVSDMDIVEGCLGSGAYDKYNWVHMKTQFKPTVGLVDIVLVAQDVNYVGTGRIRLKNFSISKVPPNINFITPPPLPHVCYYDYDGFGADLLTQALVATDFHVGNWGVGAGGGTWILPATGDLVTIGFTAVNTGVQLGNTNGYSITPKANHVYYYRFTMNTKYSGSTLTYDQLPTLYFDPFNTGNTDFTNYPFKFKNNANTPIIFEGYYCPKTMPVTPHLGFVADNQTALGSSYTMKLSGFTFQEVDAYYTSTDGSLFWYRQPHAFGYSLNNLPVNPDYAVGGHANAWAIPFVPIGHTGYTGDVAGMYEQYVRGSTTTGMTTPLMHVSTTYVNKYDKDAIDTPIDINLTHTCGLGYQFYKTGATQPSPCVTPNGVTIENEMFMSGAMDFVFDGFYPLTGSTAAGLGPFYSAGTVYGIYGNVGFGDVLCAKNVDTQVPVVNNYSENWADLRNDTGYTNHSRVAKDFATALTTISLANRSNTNYFIANRYNLIKIEASLIYDSDTDSPQTVAVKLVSADGFVYDQKLYTVGGSNNATYASISSRTLSYTYDGFYYINDEIYVMVQPQSYDCTIKQYETVDVVGNYILSGTTGTTVPPYSIFKGTKYWNAAANAGTGAWVYTRFTGDTYNYMINSVYDILRFTPTGVSGATAPVEVYGNEMDYYMCFVSGATPTATGRTITLQSKAVDRSQYSSGNQFIYGIQQLPRPFTGVTWTTYDSAGNATNHPTGPKYSLSLTGTTFSVLRHSYVKIYESTVEGIDDDLGQHLVAFYKKNGALYYRYGYSKYFFDDPIDRFYTASDATNREVFPYGTATVHAEKDGIYLTYDYAKDAAGYPITGEFVGRLTAKDTCGNFATIYLLLCMNVKSTAAVYRIGNINAQSMIIQGGGGAAIE